MTSAYHHVAVQVRDIAAARAFYVDVFDGRVLTDIRRVGPPFAGVVMGGPE